MISWAWTVDLLHASDGIIRAVDWTCTGTVGERSVSRSGRAWLGEPGEDVVPIDAVTNVHSLSWAQGRLAVDGVQAGIRQELFPLDNATLYAVEPTPAPEPAPAGPSIIVPEALTGFVLVGETPAATKARLASRWVELTHLLQMGLADSDIAHEHTLLSPHQAWLLS